MFCLPVKKYCWEETRVEQRLKIKNFGTPMPKKRQGKEKNINANSFAFP